MLVVIPVSFPFAAFVVNYAVTGRESVYDELFSFFHPFEIAAAHLFISGKRLLFFLSRLVNCVRDFMKAGTLAHSFTTVGG